MPRDGESRTAESDLCVQLRFHGRVSKSWRRILGAGLAATGMQVDESESSARIDAAVMGFECYSTDLCEALQRLSRGGQDRVLAVTEAAAGVEGRTWPLLVAGASDVVAWDRSPEPLSDIAQRLRRWAEVDRLVASPLVRDNLVGDSLAWRSVLRQVVEVAAFSDVAVLVIGESGTGKELIARLIHALDRRAEKGELVLVDCTTVVPTLSGSEFFGHEKGAFTGAISARDGAFRAADKGTLFLDEVGELPAGLQAELLRVVQDGTYKRVGSNVWHQTCFRLVCATNRDLRADELAGRFRRDLYYRIAAWICQLPSLSQRREDILPLARHCLSQLLPESSGLEFDRAVEGFLLSREYPGNVRELRQLVAQVARRHVGDGPITVGDVPPQLRPLVPPARSWPDADFSSSIQRALTQGVCLKEIVNAARETAIAITLRASAGNLQRAAGALGITDRALQLRRAAGSTARSASLEREPAGTGESIATGDGTKPSQVGNWLPAQGSA